MGLAVRENAGHDASSPLGGPPRDRDTGARLDHLACEQE